MWYVSAIALAGTIAMCILSRRCTRPAECVIYIPFMVVCALIAWNRYTTLWIIITYAALVILFVLWFIITRKIGYNLSERILSIFGIVNAIAPVPLDDGRVIGRILPYNEKQLQWNNKCIVNTDLAAAGSLLISGSTGSGKTFGILSMIRQNIRSGNSIIFAEYKGDPQVISELENYAISHGYEVYRLSSGVSNFNYDPLRNLNNTGRVEAILNMRKWSLDGSDAHFKTGTQLLLQKTIQEFTHEWVFECEKAINEGLSSSSISYTLGYYRFIQRYKPTYNEQDSYATVAKLLELLMTGSLSPMFSGNCPKTLALDEVKNKKFMLLVSFVSSNKSQATGFSSLLFQDLLDEWTVEAPKSNTFLYIDEFGTLENPFIIKDILEKGRSAKIATTLSLQDINQIVIQTNEAYLNAILGTINSFIVYSGATRVTAEKFAGVQLAEIEAVLMNLRKPINGRKPTAIYISKYPSVRKKSVSEVFRFEPYIYDLSGAKSALRSAPSVPIVNEQELPPADESWKDDIFNGRLTEDEMETVRESERITLEQVPEPKSDEETHKDLDKPKQPLKLHIKPVESNGNDSGQMSDLESLIFGDKN